MCVVYGELRFTSLDESVSYIYLHVRVKRPTHPTPPRPTRATRLVGRSRCSCIQDRMSGRSTKSGSTSNGRVEQDLHRTRSVTPGSVLSICWVRLRVISLDFKSHKSVLMDRSTDGRTAHSWLTPRASAIAFLCRSRLVTIRSTSLLFRGHFKARRPKRLIGLRLLPGSS